MPPETRFGNDKATMQKLQTLSDGKFNETKGVWSLGARPMAGVVGFEPTSEQVLTESKSVALPLGDTPI